MKHHIPGVTACTDIDLEARYLGGAMLDPRMFDEHPLASGCFGVTYHRELHAAMTAVHLRGETLTEERLDAELADRNHHAARTRNPFDLAVMLPDDPAALCERLRALSARRALVEGCDHATRQLVNGDPILGAQPLEQFAGAIEQAKAAAE